MKLKITKSNYSPISSQKILCPELPSPRLYLSLLPSFSPLPLSLLHFPLSLPLLACLLCWCCSRQNDITPLLADCSVRKVNIYVCARMYARGGMPEINIPATEILCNRRLDLKNHHLNKRSIVCVFVTILNGFRLNVCVCVCV